MKYLGAILALALLTGLPAAQGQTDSAPANAGPAEPSPVMIIAQQPQVETPPPPGGPAVRKEVRIMRGPGPMVEGPNAAVKFIPAMGAWWKNSEFVSKLQLSQEQVNKISQTYLEHKLKLIDLQADLEKQEVRLEPLMDVDQPDEGKVGGQIDLITAARGRLEKENAMMMLDIRRWLSVEQWKKLKSLQAAEERRNFIYVRSGGPAGIEVPEPPPFPGDLPVQGPW